MKDNIINTIIRFYIPSIISFVTGLASAIILTRVFPTKIYGILTIFNNSSSLILSISYLGFDSAYIRFFNDVPNGLNNKRLGCLLLNITLLIYTFFILMILFLFRAPFSKVVFGMENSIMCIGLFLNVAAQIVIRYYLITYRMQIQSKMYSTVTIISQIAIRFSVLFAALFSKNINIVIISNTAGIVLMTMGLLILRYRDLISDFRIDIKQIIRYPEIIKYSFFSAPIPIILNLNSYIAQRIITLRADYGAVGIYSSANYFNTLFSVLQSGFATFWSAFVYKNYIDEHKLISKMHDILFIIVILIYGSIILFKDILYIIIGREYHESKEFFAWVLFYPVMILLTETTGYGISIQKKNYISLFIHCIAFSINTIFALIFIRFMGLRGVALASALSGIVFYLFSTYFGQKYYKTIISLKKSIAGLVIIISMMLSSGITNDMVQKIVVLFFVILALYLYHIEVIQIINSMKSILMKKIKK